MVFVCCVLYAVCYVLCAIYYVLCAVYCVLCVGFPLNMRDAAVLVCALVLTPSIVSSLYLYVKDGQLLTHEGSINRDSLLSFLEQHALSRATGKNGENSRPPPSSPPVTVIVSFSWSVL